MLELFLGDQALLQQGGAQREPAAMLPMRRTGSHYREQQSNGVSWSGLFRHSHHERKPQLIATADEANPLHLE